MIVDTSAVLAILFREADAAEFEKAIAASANCRKGNHPAALNFGDCFAYALAETTGEPLLFKGGDFARTDITSALSPEAT